MGEELIRRALADEARCAPDACGLWARTRHRLARWRRWRVARTALCAAVVATLAAGVGWSRRRMSRARGWPRAG